MRTNNNYENHNGQRRKKWEREAEDPGEEANENRTNENEREN